MTVPEEARSEFEDSRRTAYAAVTAGLEGDGAMVAELVRELVERPMDAAGALLALIQACEATVNLWAAAIYEEPDKVWARYAATVAAETDSKEDKQ